MQPLIPSSACAADATLTPAGIRVGADEGNPQTAVKEIYTDGITDVGIWECTPGGWEVHNRDNTETCIIISGKGVIIDASGQEQALYPGAVIVLPRHWSGRWRITETLRKIYIMVD